MKTSILLASIVTCALTAPMVLAQENPAPANPMMGMDKQMPQMQESMKVMQQQMEKFRSTSDPKERQKLMQEHMLTMQENMKIMRDMGGSMMMGSNKSGMMESGTKKGYEMMENRMDMMQMMMEQMMQHTQAVESTPAK